MPRFTARRLYQLTNSRHVFWAVELYLIAHSNINTSHLKTTDGQIIFQVSILKTITFLLAYETLGLHFAGENVAKQTNT